MFDFLNVRTNFYYKNEFQHSIRPENIENWERKVEEWMAYINGLKLKPKDTLENQNNFIDKNSIGIILT